MNIETKRKCYKISTVLGALIILLPNGVAMYWGNLSVYVTSYLVACLGITSGVQEPWIVSMYLLFWTLGVMAYDYVKGCVGKRWAAILGALVTDVGIVFSFFTVQTSFVLLNVTFAVMTGIGTGLLQAHGLRLLVDWADNDTGLLVAIMQGAFNWGASTINQMVTLYLNPDNALPNIRVERSIYFTQAKVLDKVPSVFFVLGGFAVASHVVGYLLLRDNTFDKPVKEITVEQIVVNENPAERYNSVMSNFQKQTDSTTCGNDTTTETHEEKQTPTLANASRPSSTNIANDFTPHEVLKSVTFYIMWVVFFFAEYPFLLLANYYKSFGQIWIHNDHFLTDLGTVLSFVVIVMRIFWGLGMDMVGVRNCLVIEILTVAIITVWYYFTANINKWLYFVVTNLYAALSAALFSSIAVAVVSMFGKTHFSTNYGLLRSSSIILSVACPFMTEAILDHLGWFYIFGSASFVNVIGLILILFFVPRF